MRLLKAVSRSLPNLQYRNGSKVAVLCHTVEDHRAVKDGLRWDGRSFLTYTRKDEKSPKVVLKGLPAYVEDALPAELENLSYKVSSITRLRSKQATDQSCLPFLVQLAPGADIAKFRQIKYLCNCVIKIEKSKPNRSLGTQCFRCQEFGHSSQNCNMPARCVKCTGLHASSECPKKDRSGPAQCCNCDGDHPANYSNCSARLTYLERLRKKRDTERKPPLLPRFLPKSFTAKTVDSSQSWAAVVTSGPAVGSSRPVNNKVLAAASATEAPTPRSGDSATDEMLDILLAIRKVKSQFILCKSQLEKVTLVLTQLGQYV